MPRPSDDRLPAGQERLLLGDVPRGPSATYAYINALGASPIQTYTYRICGVDSFGNSLMTTTVTVEDTTAN